MGVNNRQRRAAKQRKRAQQRSSGRPTPAGGSSAGGAGAPGFEQIWDGQSAYALVEMHVYAAVNRTRKHCGDVAMARSRAQSMLRQVQPAPVQLVQQLVLDLLTRALDPVMSGGWGPDDLVQLVSRSGDPSHVPALVTLMHDEVRRNRDRGARWQAALSAYGDDPRLRFDTADQLASALVLVALLPQAPLLTAEALTEPLSSTADETATHPKLARVRALLAKAESTTFPEEAETLTAKAQELISRYSLEAMLDRSRPGTAGGADLVTRRIWLDAPYVSAKSSLVDVVAAANHCRTAFSAQHGFSILIGARHDLDATELLVTSLLVQADRAMLVHGSQFDLRGASRTRSFRQSFLIAYASRIGQRLTDAGEAAVAADSATFLPVLRSHEEQVSAAFDALVPHTVGRSRSISNHQGWAAGYAAADQAQLGFREQIRDTAG